MILETLFILYLFFNFMDFTLTAYGLRTGDFEEFNPVARKLSIRGIALIKTLVSLTTFGILQIPWNPFGTKFLELSLIISIVYFATVSLYNLVLILSHARIVAEC